MSLSLNIEESSFSEHSRLSSLIYPTKVVRMDYLQGSGEEVVRFFLFYGTWCACLIASAPHPTKSFLIRSPAATESKNDIEGFIAT